MNFAVRHLAKLSVSVILLACCQSAFAFTIGSDAIPMLFSYPPDPKLFPTDFHAAAPDFDDTSGILRWPNGRLEPGPHEYIDNFPTRGIRLRNALDERRVKHVFLHFQYNPDFGDPEDPEDDDIPVSPQPHGEDFNQFFWIRATTSGGERVTATGASWVQDSETKILHVYQTWTIKPQPSSEFIDLDRQVPEDFMWVQTICIPEPATLLLTLLPLALTGMRRRRT